MRRNADADGLAPFVQQAPRNFARGVQYEGVCTGGTGAEHAVLPVVDPRVHRRLADVAANQREVMPRVDAANAAYPFHCRLVADVAGQRVARVRRISDDPPLAQDVRRLPDQPRLRIEQMN